VPEVGVKLVDRCILHEGRELEKEYVNFVLNKNVRLFLEFYSRCFLNTLRIFLLYLHILRRQIAINKTMVLFRNTNDGL